MTLPLRAPLVTRRQLADALGCHMQTVTKYEREGLPIAQRGDRGKASLYDLVDVQAWLTSRGAAAEAPIALTEVEAVWAAEIAAVRMVLLSTYAARADRLTRAALASGPAGVARELSAITAEVLRTLALVDRPGEVVPFGPRAVGPTSPVAEAVKRARAGYAPPVATPVMAPRRAVEPATVSPPLRRRVAPSSYLGR